jgi:dTDP-4-dehydrorhamnose reductase
MTIRALVTGANGMLGTDLCRALAQAQIECIPTALDSPDYPLDITDTQVVWKTMERAAPTVVIHCAAYTDVDAAERDPDTAFRVNALGTWNLAAACAAFDTPLCALSTDFVFDGAQSAPYTEFDPPAPLNQYGKSKLAGENCVRALCPKHWIVRTAWLFGAHGKCFPDTILRAAQTRPQLQVVADQFGTPTYTADLAAALIRLIRSPLYGTYHLVNTGVTSWYEFARKTLEMAGVTQARIEPIRSVDWISPARRPRNSALRAYALELQGAPPLRPWEQALADYLQARARRQHESPAPDR